MDYLLLLYSQVAFSHVSDDMQRLQLVQSVMLSDVLLKISVFAKFCHYVYIVLGHENLDCSQHMRI